MLAPRSELAMVGDAERIGGAESICDLLLADEANDLGGFDDVSGRLAIETHGVLFEVERRLGRRRYANKCRRPPRWWFRFRKGKDRGLLDEPYGVPRMHPRAPTIADGPLEEFRGA